MITLKIPTYMINEDNEEIEKNHHMVYCMLKMPEICWR